MLVATWNVNSIRARYQRVLGWIERARPDVLCLQETKVPDDAFPALEIKALGYEAALWGQKAYNGVAVLSRHPIEDARRGFEDGGDDTQARFVVCRIRGLEIASCYVPNGQAPGTEKFAYKLDWLWRLRRWLDRSPPPAAGRSLLLCGDWNVTPVDLDVHDPVQWKGQILCSEDERAALARVMEWGLVDVYRAQHPGEAGHFSWWDYRLRDFERNRGLRIDLVLATPPVAARVRAARIDRAEREGKGASDHAPVVVELGE